MHKKLNPNQSPDMVDILVEKNPKRLLAGWIIEFKSY